MGTEYRTLYGSGVLHDRLCGLSFDIAPAAFYQVNHDAAELLYGIAGDCAGLTGRELLLDLYCGAGTIGLSLSHRVRAVVGIEIEPAAVRNARANAEKTASGTPHFTAVMPAMPSVCWKRPRPREGRFRPMWSFWIRLVAGVMRVCLIFWRGAECRRLFMCLAGRIRWRVTRLFSAPAVTFPATLSRSIFFPAPGMWNRCFRSSDQKTLDFLHPVRYNLNIAP